MIRAFQRLAEMSAMAKGHSTPAAEHPTNLPRSAEFLNDEPETIEAGQYRTANRNTLPAIVDERLLLYIRPASRVARREAQVYLLRGAAACMSTIPLSPKVSAIGPLTRLCLSLARLSARKASDVIELTASAEVDRMVAQSPPRWRPTASPPSLPRAPAGTQDGQSQSGAHDSAGRVG